MKSCSIVPPTEVLAEYYGTREEENGADAAEPIDPALESICMKALSRRPEDRYPTCRAFWEALHEFAESQSSS